ncbi:unnamed protein product [Phytophthora lilii]|uniref:Unnamed protein product n=1 Tax=Phytophthora lilii TaxID=2077276 RepID=A0A9W6TBA3_9STRA|nr:unnamed protein product [Phytophthora lilii]
MQLLTEISAGYAAALDELQEARERQSAQQLSRHRRQLLDEIHAVLDVVFSFLQDVVGDAKPDAKVLPQLLGLVPDTGNPFEDPPMSNGLSLALDWRDLFLLLHSLQASKPILHHRTSSSRIATEAAVFTDIEQLAWSIIQSDIRTFINSNGVGLRTASTTIEKRVLDQVELLLNFGGKQIHAREWKALLLMDIAFFWIEKNDTGVGDTNASASKPALALSILQAIFEMVRGHRDGQPPPRCYAH